MRLLLYKFLALMLFSFPLSAHTLSLLKAASGKVDITPAIGDSVYCMKVSRSPVEAIHDKIYARILILDQRPQQVVLVSLDLLYFGDQEVQVLDSLIRKQTGIKDLIITNTHTHSGFFVPDDLALMSTKIGMEIIKIRKKLMPVSVSYASTLVDEVYNRRMVKEGKVQMLWQNPDRIYSPAADSSLNILLFENKQHQCVSVLVDYTAHPVITMNFDKVEVSADYPGALTAELDQQLGGTSVFVLGAAGDLNPYDAGTGPAKGSFEKAVRLGKYLAQNTKIACKTAQIYDGTHLIYKKQAVQVTYKGHVKTVSIYILALNKELALIGLPGELFSELGMAIKQSSPFKHTMVMSYTGSTTIGYIPDAKAAAEGGYGAENLPIAKGTGELLVNESLKLLNEVNGNYRKEEEK